MQAIIRILPDVQSIIRVLLDVQAIIRILPDVQAIIRSLPDVQAPGNPSGPRQYSTLAWRLKLLHHQWKDLLTVGRKDGTV